MQDEREILWKYIKSKGLRYTPEREAILEEIFSKHEHFDVDALYLRLKKKQPKISKASIYRTIPLLLESGLISEVYFEDGHLHYEHIHGHKHHCHMRCLGCRKVIEFYERRLEEVQEKVAKQHGFMVTGHKLELVGYCQDCVEKESDEKEAYLKSG